MRSRLTGRPPGFLANDFGTNITAANYSLPGSGVLTVVRTDGSFTYQPSYGFSGATTFNYSIVDVYNRTASATVTIGASKSVPLAHDDHFTLNATTPQLRAPGLLANDTGGIGALSVSNYQLASSGVVSDIRTDGSFLYQAEPGFEGTTGFDYFSVDALGRSSSGHVTINVGAVPEPSTWAMPLGGLAVVGCGAYRRRMPRRA